MNPKTIKGILASAVFALVVACIFAALTLYGVVSVVAARIVLAGAWLIAVLGTAFSEIVWDKPLRHKIGPVFAVAIIFGFGFWQLDTWALRKKVESETNPAAMTHEPRPSNEPAEKKEPPIEKLKPKKNPVSEDPLRLVSGLSDSMLERESDTMIQKLKKSWDAYHHGPDWRLFDQRMNTDDNEEKKKIEQQREKLREQAYSENKSDILKAIALKDECLKRPGLVKKGNELIEAIAPFTDSEYYVEQEHQRH